LLEQLLASTSGLL